MTTVCSLKMRYFTNTRTFYTGGGSLMTTHLLRRTSYSAQKTDIMDVFVLRYNATPVILHAQKAGRHSSLQILAKFKVSVSR